MTLQLCFCGGRAGFVRRPAQRKYGRNGTKVVPGKNPHSQNPKRHISVLERTLSADSVRSPKAVDTFPT